MRVGFRSLVLACAVLQHPAGAGAGIHPLMARSELKLASGAPGANLGIAVAISGDTAIVGAMLDDGAAPASGSAYVFVRSGNTWTQQAKLTASDGAAGDLFGVSVAIDGDTAVVGAVGDDDAGNASGSAYVFVRAGGLWTQQAKLTASDAAEGDYFGEAVAVSGDTVVVGAFYDQDAGYASGSTYVFVRSGGAWSEDAKLAASDAAADDYFGAAVAIDGDRLVVGAPENDDAGTQSGSAYVFVRTGGVWSEEAKLTASDASAESFFGGSLAGDGDTVIVGTRNLVAAGSAYVFDRSGTAWNEEARLISGAAGVDFFGATVDLAGDTAIVGAWSSEDAGIDAGAVHVFGRMGATWAEQARIVASDAIAGQLFGGAVAIAGPTLIVGAPYDDDGGNASGSTCVYDLEPGQNVGGTIVISDRVPEDPGRSSLRFNASPSSIAAPTPGSPADPRCGASNGGSIRVKSNASGQDFSQALPCARWEAIGDAANPKGYQYVDAEYVDGPCRRIVVRAGRLRARCAGRTSPLAYDLQIGQSQAPVTLLLTVGAETYCARFGGVVTRDGSNGRSFAARRAPTTTACE